METELRDHLVACAEAYAGLTGRARATVGRLAAKDWRFFDRIQNGEGFTARKYDEVIGWFAVNWPADKPWPSDVPRPVEDAAA